MTIEERYTTVAFIKANILQLSYLGNHCNVIKHLTHDATFENDAFKT